MKPGRPGQPDLGPFSLARFLGRGATGEVWLGRHVESGTRVAVKILHDRSGARPASRERFQGEVQAIANLAHPSIVRLFDCGSINDAAARRVGGPVVAGSPYLVMELVDGGSLERRCGTLSWEEVRGVLRQVLGALAHAHARRVIHRDIKPGNVLSTRDGMAVKLTDFGLATSPRASLPASPDDPAPGTPAYMAPEQFSGTWRDHGPSTDLYAVGGLACALVTGFPPFGPATDFEAAREAHLCAAPPSLPSGCPARFEEWVHVLMRKEPHRRFRCAADAAAALDEVRWPGPRPRPAREAGLGGRRRGSTPDIGFAAEFAAPRADGMPAPQAPQTPLSGTGLGLHGVWTARMFGREAECGALWHLMETVAQDGCARLSILRGPSGYGKSRLAEWLGERAAESGAAAVLAAMHSPVPGHSDGLRDMLGRLFRTHGLSRERALARLFRWLARLPTFAPASPVISRG
ncbi:MAG: serine/threonine-protein kinase PknK [Deltaproteobacteria bacterium]|nr:serine/threonine-protein kinase PknK [Deltaproteobacteria bacterium]